MTIFFRTHQFDTSSKKEDYQFYGEDLAIWFSSNLDGWKYSVYEEDWGWCIDAQKGNYSYMFGVYDHDISDENKSGNRWCIRVYNQNDKSHWFKKIFKYIPPVADDEVTQEILDVLKEKSDFSDIEIETLT